MRHSFVVSLLLVALSASAVSSQPTFNWADSAAISPPLTMYGAPFSAPSASIVQTQTFLTYLSSDTVNSSYTINAGSGWSAPKTLPYQGIGPITNHQYGYGGAGTATDAGSVYISWTTPNNNHIAFNHIAYMVYSQGAFGFVNEYNSGSQYQPAVATDNPNEGDVLIYHNGNEGSGCYLVTISGSSTSQSACPTTTSFSGGLTSRWYGSANTQFTAYVGSNGVIWYINGNNAATATSYLVDADSALSVIEYDSDGYDYLVLFYKYDGIINYVLINSKLIFTPQSTNRGYSTGYSCTAGGAGALYVAPSGQGTGTISLFFQKTTLDNLVYLGVGTLSNP